jgi:hypothetical protein
MMIPTVHLNGTSRKELVQQYLTAREALRRALDALFLAHPHGRDYYVQGPDALKRAEAEHRARVQKLTEVHDELGDIAEAING